MSHLRVVSDPEALAHAAAQEFLRLGVEAIRARGRFDAVLSGGSTPRATYERIAATWKEAPGGPLDWTRVRLFWGDERHVPPDDPQNNYRMANDAMIEHVPIPPENIYPVPSAIPDAREAASRYEARIMEALHLGPDDVPRFDLILLGMGPDGHVASIFPGTEAVEEEKRLVMGNWVDATKTWRITLTLPVLNHAANVIVLVAGAEKAPALRRVVRGPHTPPLLPAERLNNKDGTLLWLADREAAGAPPD
ncbi:MAG TPA: 6-phosphogluconolactonase [Candidatus Eisenbacteria bacterium]|nr:6-phosphogluconolactonase [Candidatus Eisenbacteria bacterium]